MKHWYTLCLVLILVVSLVLPVTADALQAARPLTDAYGKSLTEWQLLHLSWLLGGDPVDHVGHVRFLPLPQGTPQGENPVIFVGELATTLDPGAPFVLPIFVWIGESYDNGSADEPLPSDLFTAMTVTMTLDGQPLLDSNTEPLTPYYFGPQPFQSPIPYAEPQPRGDTNGDGEPDLFALAMVWAQGIGFVYPPLSIGQHTLTLYAENAAFGFGYDNTWQITVTPPVVETVYLSLHSSGQVGDIQYRNEDIVAYEPATGVWSLYFDGSDVGLSNRDVDAFALTTDGRLLLSLDTPHHFPGLGTVDDSDIVKFIPTSLGEQTAGRFVWHFDGSDVNLRNSGEDIDALALMPDGQLILSTSGSMQAGGVTGKDEDLFLFTATQLGKQTQGTWQRYLDGSAIGLTNGSEDIDGIGLRPFADGALYLSTKGNFTATSSDSLNGDANDIFGCQPNSLGTEKPLCLFVRYFDGDQVGLDHARIDGFFIGTTPAMGTSTIPVDSAESELVTAALEESMHPETVEADAEVDEYDLLTEEEKTLQQIFLPVVVQP